MLWPLLVSSVKPYWRLLVGVIVFQFAQAMVNLYLPTLNADIIDKGVAVGDTGYIWRMGGWMLLLSFVGIACTITAVYFGAKIAMRVGRDLRGDIFGRVGTFSEAEVQRFGAPSLITRTSNDVQQVQMLVLMTCTLLMTTPFTLIGGIILALEQDVELSWIMAVAIPLLLVIVSLIVWRMVPHFRRMQVRIDGINRVLREQLTGIRVVRAFVREHVEEERFGDANDLVTESALKAGRLMAAMFPLVLLVVNISSAAVIWFGGYRIDAGEMQVGALTAFLSYLIQILFSVLMATFLFVLVPRAAVSADRIGEVLSTRSTVTVDDAAVEVPSTGEVVFEDVTFTYPGAEQPVLAGISFTARRGTTTAIIGSTGAGKSTLVNLIPRLYDATGGTVRVGGVDVRDADLESLWTRIGVVPQRPYLFAGTVASNLRYGREEATDDELWEALAIAQGEDFVRAMPERLDTPVAQGGTTVSGGQRQRLSIARALVRRPDILVFDDSFSALDTATDARLRAALDRDVTDATVIVVAQRVSSIVDADQILVMEDGRIVDRGTHAELLETSPTYQEIVSTQLRAEEVAG
ncbi:ABC transporter ATP-binding protein [Demequina lignilytica]|uniref:ABC transporter ATP-binding protein n=1 Tax=Demequina lignilytica TaxID=3051663 RepID=A0AAW7M6P3_9MICO|nr:MULTISPECIES: ABC transporter ATP-binding protein [unclassified Demequina]MDN4479135.1 ABC transporter ATP-binding protein [Demequina sp. SYSU T00039-1]MDN4482573.1 ABC transporter ATP-binding protein [Demequina sp. SYSU T0a273]MDN4489152.1 ABC transporter ATP-binding protein [Demequina sp. SYSU T00039]MDN4490255.1 ABC transporter ATP-binding protein [Demequina sp. SYSU T00068]